MDQNDLFGLSLFGFPFWFPFLAFTSFGFVIASKGDHLLVPGTLGHGVLFTGTEAEENVFGVPCSAKFRTFLGPPLRRGRAHASINLLGPP